MDHLTHCAPERTLKAPGNFESLMGFVRVGGLRLMQAVRVLLYRTRTVDSTSCVPTTGL